MNDDGIRKALMESRAIEESKEGRRSRVISKLLAARWELEDVLVSSKGNSVLSLADRTRVSGLLGAIDSIVRRVERCMER